MLCCRASAKCLGPTSGRELVNAAIRVRRDAEQDVLQIVEWRDANELTTLDERIQEGRPAGTLKAPCEEPVAATHGDDA